MVMEAYDHADFRTAVNGADLVTPDGMPLVWTLRCKGIHGQQRVYGPTLMLEVLRAAERAGVAVGFLGSTAEIRQAMLARFAVEFPRLRVCQLPEMPFGLQSEEQDEALTAQIEATGVRILFVALGCPAQERWIAAHRGRIQAVMLGVGAAFAFHAGVVRQAPAWIQRLGLEWLFRLTQEPGRLWKRYLKHNPRFMILEAVEIIRDKMK
ncbi:MAG: WecB/TagA/CpsF family glycosyltransferase [Anaerolineaceae bacterium]|nr:WecB/TagA/CpsF family glycosyltransferase [Anaerolineaceae bacterium]